jgi:hypothetical protein
VCCNSGLASKKVATHNVPPTWPPRGGLLICRGWGGMKMALGAWCCGAACAPQQRRISTNGSKRASGTNWLARGCVGNRPRAASRERLWAGHVMFVRPGPDTKPVPKVSLVTRVGDLACGVVDRSDTTILWAPKYGAPDHLIASREQRSQLWQGAGIATTRCFPETPVSCRA